MFSLVKFEEAEVVHVVLIAFPIGFGRWEQVCACTRFVDNPLAHH